MFQAVKRMFGHQIKMPALDEELLTFTPDVAKLEQYYLQNVFLYGETMRGCSRYSELLEGTVHKLAAGFTRDASMVLLKKDLGNYTQVFSMPIRDEHYLGNNTFYGTVPSRILGHVYTMRPGQIIRLDNYMENGIQYHRNRIKIIIPYRTKLNNLRIKDGDNVSEVRSVTISAWAYLGNPSYWNEQFHGGGNKLISPVKKYKSKRDGEHYFFYSEKVERK